MALATKCPHCNTIFRVAHDQLKLRGGIVRCGACNEVFDGNAALVEPVAKPSPVMPSVPVAFAPVEPPHHLDPETVAGALAEERLQDELPATPELLDAMPSGDHETGAAASASTPEAAGDSGPSANRAVDESGPAEVDGDHDAAEILSPADVESAVPAGADATLPAEAGSFAPAEDEHIAAADAETIATADGLSPAGEPAADDLPTGQAPDGGDAPFARDAASTADEQADAQDALSAHSPSREHTRESDDDSAASLDFIVDPDEFTDPLASPQAQDTAREHLVAAALDEAHHFNDLPAADAAQAEAGEPATPPATEEAEDETQQDAVANRNADEAAAAELISAAPESASLAATGSAAAVVSAAAAEDEDSAEEPGFVKRANRRQRLHRISKAIMAFGSPILLAALVAQGVTTFRNPLAAAFPALKPTLNTLCEPLGCKVNLPMQIDMLAIEQGELQTLADNTFSFATVLRNQARNAQSWPSIELTLNDANDKALVRRVFTPRDYLPSQADVDKGFAPRSEQSIKLYFELSQVKASGYHIAIFYP